MRQKTDKIPCFCPIFVSQNANALTVSTDYIRGGEIIPHIPNTPTRVPMRNRHPRFFVVCGRVAPAIARNPTTEELCLLLPCRCCSDARCDAGSVGSYLTGGMTCGGGHGETEARDKIEYIPLRNGKIIFRSGI